MSKKLQSQELMGNESILTKHKNESPVQKLYSEVDYHIQKINKDYIIKKLYRGKIDGLKGRERL